MILCMRFNIVLQSSDLFIRFIKEAKVDVERRVDVALELLLGS